MIIVQIFMIAFVIVASIFIWSTLRVSIDGWRERRAKRREEWENRRYYVPAHARLFHYGEQGEKIFLDPSHPTQQLL